MNIDFEVNILLEDPYGMLNLKEHVSLLVHPPETFVDRPNIRSNGDILAKSIAVLNPMKTPHKSLALKLPTLLSPDIALTFGFGVSQNGLATGENLWKNIAAISRNASLKGILQDTLRSRQRGAQEISTLQLEWATVMVELGRALAH